MRVVLNDKEFIFPSSLSEITIGQRINFYNEHGQLLDKMLTSILAMEDEIFRELELVEFQYEKMIRTFAFFANTTPEAIKASHFVDDIARIYHSCLAVLVEEEQAMEPQQEFIWNKEEWELAPPVLNQASQMKFEELIDSKQMIKDMVEAGRGKWEYMVKLCAVYFRKKGERYKEEFLYEDSDRIKLMHELPMDFALQVGFFLSVSLNFWINTLMSSASPGPKEAVII